MIEGTHLTDCECWSIVSFAALLRIRSTRLRGLAGRTRLRGLARSMDVHKAEHLDNRTR